MSVMRMIAIALYREAPEPFREPGNIPTELQTVPLSKHTARPIAAIFVIAVAISPASTPAPTASS